MSIKTIALIAPFALYPMVPLAQTFPSKPIHYIAGAPVGSITDVAARTLGDEMGKRIGQPIIVENRPGAGLSISGNAVVSAAPDGYTLYYGNATSFHPIFLKNNAVNAATQLTPITQVLSGPYFVVARASLGVKTLKELVAYSKANPGKVNFGSVGANADLGIAMVKARLGLDYTRIPYQGDTGAISALLADQVEFVLSAIPPYLPHIQSGKIVALFNTTDKRSSLLPNVPAAGEAGLTDYAIGGNHGLWGPRGLSADVVQKLNTAAVAAIKSPGVSEKFRKDFSVEPVGSTPQGAMANFQSDIKFLAEAAKISGYEPQ